MKAALEAWVPTAIFSSGSGKAKIQMEAVTAAGLFRYLAQKTSGDLPFDGIPSRVPEVIPKLIVDSLVGQVVRAVGFPSALWKLYIPSLA
jgi:hypothetical protein